MFRGISVICSIGKIFEKLLAKQILNHFEFNSFFTNIQHGFRKHFSTETALQTILDKLKNIVNQNEIILSLFIDFQKAFLLIYSELLLLKLYFIMVLIINL